MTGWRHTVDMIGLEVTDEQAFAMDYLESVGQRFCVDFGVDNAVDKAADHWTGRLDEGVGV